MSNSKKPLVEFTVSVDPVITRTLLRQALKPLKVTLTNKAVFRSARMGAPNVHTAKCDHKIFEKLFGVKLNLETKNKEWFAIGKGKFSAWTAEAKDGLVVMVLKPADGVTVASFKKSLKQFFKGKKV